MLRSPGETDYHVDSTPLAYELERRHPGERSIIPDDPAQAFLAHLIEDMADEWCTKAMFHYRWAYAPDIHYASHWIADDGYPDARGDERAAMAKSFADRQISRMPLVGCTPANAPIIEECFLRVLDLLEGHVGLHDYLFGSRPSLADFGLFGQLKTLATDPTPLAIMRARAQRTEDWIRQLDDASGIEGAWLAADAPLPDATTGLLALAGEVYLPFLAANAEAFGNGDETVSLDLLGKPYSQVPFRYQVKCLSELRARLRGLDDAAMARARPILRATGCWDVLAATTGP
jgi:glutathione S-transferase